MIKTITFKREDLRLLTMVMQTLTDPESVDQASEAALHSLYEKIDSFDFSRRSDSITITEAEKRLAIDLLYRFLEGSKSMLDQEIQFIERSAWMSDDCIDAAHERSCRQIVGATYLLNSIIEQWNS